jgi:hypothetical protein
MTDKNGLLAAVHGRALKATTMALALLGALALAAPALAVEHHPKGDFAPFADCPLSNAATNACLLAHTESGKFIVGKKTVPIEHVITLQGGIHEVKSEEGELERLEFIGAEDGNTLSKTPQSVPGGLAGLINCREISNFLERVTCELTFENGLTGVNATTELAAPASSIGISVQNLIEGEGTALSLPVKVHLENPLLGSGCYVGSNAHPIVINLTTGTTSPPPPNTPISGKVGKLEFKDSDNRTIVRENSLVNNSFGAPRSEGCGGLFSFLIGPIIDSQLGLPSGEGHNTAVLNGTLEDANAAAVRASE